MTKQCWILIAALSGLPSLVLADIPPPPAESNKKKKPKKPPKPERRVGTEAEPESAAAPKAEEKKPQPVGRRPREEPVGKRAAPDDVPPVIEPEGIQQEAPAKPRVGTTRKADPVKKDDKSKTKYGDAPQP
jgi:hypothetical protein